MQNICFFAALLLIGSLLPLTIKAQDLEVGPTNVTINITTGTNIYGSISIGGGTNNSLNVLNAGTLLTNSNSLIVGNSGSDNSMVISNGAVVSSRGETSIGLMENSTRNSVLVTGSNSQWNVIFNEDLGSFGDIYVGGYGSGKSSLVISNGATVSLTQNFYIGAKKSSNNTVIVTGSNSLLTNNAYFYMGNFSEGLGNNRLEIVNGGKVVSTWGRIGNWDTVSNSILVTDSNSLLQFLPYRLPDTTDVVAGDLIIGVVNSHGNRLIISNGGTVEVFGFSIVGSASDSSSNSVLATGQNSLWSINGYLRVGDAAKQNSLVISNGAKVGVTDDAFVGYEVDSSLNSVLVTDSNSLWSNAQKLYIGYNGASNSLTVASGGEVTAVDSYIGYHAASSNNYALVTGFGSVWSNSGMLTIGEAGSGTLTVANGAAVYAGAITIAASNLSKGTLNIGSYGGNDEAGSITTDVISFSNGTGTINFNQRDSMSIASAITGNGSLMQLGTGTTTLTSSNSYSGGTTIESGKMVALDIMSLGTGPVAINGGILQLGISNSTVLSTISGTITNNGVLNYGYNGNIMTLTNAAVGSGVIGQVGTGVLTVGSVGLNSDFTGSFSVSNGTLAIATNSAFGNSTNFYLAGNGTLLATDGVNTITHDITVTNGMGIIDNDSGGILSLAGTLTKSGTVLVLAGGIFDVAGQVTGGTPGTFNSDLIISNATATLNNGNNNYIGPTYLVAGSTLVNGLDDAMPTDTILHIGAESDGSVSNIYDMAGFQQTITGLSSATNLSSVNIVTNSGAATILTIDDTSRGTALNTTYAGSIAGNIALIRSGLGAITLSQNNSYTGGTTIISGKIITSANLSLGTGAVNLLGGTLELQYKLDIPSLHWDGAATIAMANPAGGQFVNIGGLLTLTNGINNFDLTGAALPRSQIKLMVSPNMPAFSTNDFGVLGVGRYSLFVNDDTLYITDLPDSYVPFAVTPNQASVAAALNKFMDAPGDRGTVADALDYLSDIEYPAAFEQLMPTPYASLPTMAFNTANALNSGMFQRLWMTRINGRGFSSSGISMDPLRGEMGGVDDMAAFAISPSKDTKWGTFVDGNGIFANGGDVAYLQNYRSQSGGVTAGASYKWNDNLATGVYAGYQGLQAEYSNGRTIDNAVRFGVFGTYDIDNFYINALVGGAYHGYTVNRYINFGGLDRTATGRPGAGEFDLALNTGYDFKAGDFAFGPFTGMQYTYVGVQGFTETGADALNLKVDPYDSSSLLYTLGAQAAYNWRASSRVIVTPIIFAGWQHEFLQDSYQINSSFNTGGPAAPFSYNTGTPARDNFYGGVGATVGLGDRWQATAIYSSFVGGQSQSSQNVYLGLAYKF